MFHDFPKKWLLFTENHAFLSIFSHINLQNPFTATLYAIPHVPGPYLKYSTTLHFFRNTSENVDFSLKMTSQNGPILSQDNMLFKTYIIIYNSRTDTLIFKWNFKVSFWIWNEICISSAPPNMFNFPLHSYFQYKLRLWWFYFKW